MTPDTERGPMTGEELRDRIAKEVHAGLSRHLSKGHSAAPRISFATADRIAAAIVEKLGITREDVATVRFMGGHYDGGMSCVRSADALTTLLDAAGADDD